MKYTDKTKNAKLDCTVVGCFRPVKAKGLCNAHYVSRYQQTKRAGVVRYDHIVLAERVLGKPLPHGAVIHHIDGDPANNSNDNLVICPNQEYHKLLHKREEALRACGHPDWLKCHMCEQYSSPSDPDLRIFDRKVYHKSCDTIRARLMRGSSSEGQRK